jgi:Frequency clock protein
MPRAVNTRQREPKRCKIGRGSNDATSDGASGHIVEELTTQPMTKHSSTAESASQWFDSVNKNINHHPRRGSPDDQEPPFYIASQEPYSDLPHSGATSRAFGGASGLVDDSEKDDLRDVIDDLTIENKKLKRKLRSGKSRNSRSSRAPSSRVDDKLFELRVHGLRADKKRELEVLLKNFASSLGADTIPSKSTASRSSDQLATNSPTSMSGPGAQNAKLIHTDSGYGSNSHPGMARLALPMPPVSMDHTIKSYLHDIPDVLLPRDSYRMSDKAKMALVVRRLEQLFTGKQALSDDHAERLEAISRSLKNQTEGSREAHILPPDSNINLDASEAPSPVKGLHSKLKSYMPTPSPATGTGSISSPIGSPDQRPTRPRDLDIRRAQVAKDNIEYIRHLGLSAPGLDIKGAKKNQWIYLNLLVSMAQLHDLNVTPDFIRRAIKKQSTKFELSKDLRSVRWKGGVDTTTFSMETVQAMDCTTASLADPLQGESVGGKTFKTDGGSNRRASFTPSDDHISREESSNTVNQKYPTLATSPSSKPQVPTWEKTSSAFDYKPMFYKHKAALRREALSPVSSSSVTTDSTDLVDKMSRSTLSDRSQDGEGILTFFNNPFFCSDFSADKHPAKYSRNALSGLADYSRGVLGITQPEQYEENPLREHDACYFAPQFAAKFTEPMSKRALKFEPYSIQRAGEDETQPMEMEASGLGMTVPADNFVIYVKVGMEPVVGRHTLKPKSRLQKTIPVHFDYHIQSAHCVDLQPSRLPSPSYVFFTPGSSSNHDAMDEDSDNSDSSSSLDDVSPAPRAFMRTLSTESSSNRGSMEDMDMEDMEDMDEDDS